MLTWYDLFVLGFWMALIIGCQIKVVIELQRVNKNLESMEKIIARRGKGLG